MSDTVISGTGRAARPEHDRRRAAVSMAAAVILHAIAIVAIALIVAANPAPAPLQPISVSLLVSSSASPLEQPAVSGSPVPSTGVVPTVSAPGSGGTRASSSSSDSFVIPSPRAQPAGAATTGASGPGFRQAGGTTGGAASLPAIQSPVPGATLPAAQSGSGSGTGTGSTQHAGQGVTVTDPSAGTIKGSLDLSGLDKALAGSASGGSGTARAATGSGSGGSAGAGGSGGASVAGPDYRVVWDQPDISKGRDVVRADTPKIPSRVGKQGLTLSVTVAFTLGADGLLSGVALEQSSGYADVDSAVMDAIRRWRFTSAPGAGPIKGLIPYRITLR